MTTPLLSLEELADKKIREVLLERDDDSVIRVRVSMKSAMAYHYGMQFVDRAEQTPDDETIDHDGVMFLIDPESAPLLQGSTLKYVNDDSGSGFTFDNPNKTPLMENPVAVRVHEVIQEKINPGVASHGGSVDLVDVQGDKAFIRFSGGCQGCGQADVTLKDGVENTILSEVPEIHHVVDGTNHAEGENPYFQ